jgi:hypothetical protein
MHYVMKAYGGIDPHFLDLGTNWRWVVSFTPRPLYPWEKSPRYPLDRMLGGPQSHSGRHGEEKILDLTGTRTPTYSVVQTVASRYTDYVIPAPNYSITLLQWWNYAYLIGSYMDNYKLNIWFKTNFYFIITIIPARGRAVKNVIGWPRAVLHSFHTFQNGTGSHTLATLLIPWVSWVRIRNENRMALQHGRWWHPFKGHDEKNTPRISFSRVEACYNNSTVSLRVAKGDDNGNGDITGPPCHRGI